MGEQSLHGMLGEPRSKLVLLEYCQQEKLRQLQFIHALLNMQSTTEQKTVKIGRKIIQLQLLPILHELISEAYVTKIKKLMCKELPTE